MTIRRFISKILGPPAVLFLVLVTCYVAYQILEGISYTKAMKSEASVAIDRFHDRFNKDDFSSACENEYAWHDPQLNCVSQLKDVKLRFGAFQKLKKVNFEVSSEPQWVRIESVSIFDKGELAETFFARHISERDLGIVSYRAGSPRPPPVE